MELPKRTIKAVDLILSKERTRILKGIEEGASLFPNVYKDALEHATVLNIGGKTIIACYLTYKRASHTYYLIPSDMSKDQLSKLERLESYLCNPEDIPRVIASIEESNRTGIDTLMILEALTHFMAGEPMFTAKP